jgi:hypothetical protein
MLKYVDIRAIFSAELLLTEILVIRFEVKA